MSLASKVETVNCPVCHIAMKPSGEVNSSPSPPRRAEAQNPAQPTPPGTHKPSPAASKARLATPPKRTISELKVAKPVTDKDTFSTTDTARTLVDKAENEAREIRRKAEQDAEKLLAEKRKEAEQEKAKIVETASGEADSLKEKARAEANSLLEKAEEEARRKADAARQTALEQMEKEKKKVIESTRQKVAALKRQAREDAEQTAKKAEEGAEQIKQKAQQDAEPLKQKVGAVKEKTSQQPPKESEPDLADKREDINLQLKREARFIMGGMSFSLLVLVFCVFLLTQAGLRGAMRAMTMTLVFVDCGVFASLAWIVWGHYRNGKAAVKRHKERQKQQLEKRRARAERQTSGKTSNHASPSQRKQDAPGKGNRPVNSGRVKSAGPTAKRKPKNGSLPRQKRSIKTPDALKAQGLKSDNSGDKQNNEKRKAAKSRGAKPTD